MQSMSSKQNTIVGILRERASEQPTTPAFTFLEDDATETYDFATLNEQANLIGQGLLERVDPGDRVVLLCPPGLDYISLLFGGFYAGVIPVPLYPPRLKQRTDRIESVMKSCGAALIVTTDKLLEPLQAYFDDAGEQFTNNIVSIGQLRSSASHGTLPCLDPEQTAFIQYTSGSTGTPKGVMVSHGNIVANLQALTDVTGCVPEDIYVNWLPLFHDLGLINTIMLPLFHGCHSILMNAASFVQKPVRWLQAINTYRGTICGAPNFAYDLLLARISDEQLEGLDLSCWKIAFNAAEPINAETLVHFARRFACAGFKEEAMYPAYGMAEATVFISGGESAAAPLITYFDKEALKSRQAIAVEEQGQPLVACGQVAPHHSVKIVDPDTLLESEPGSIGEIWVDGPSIAQGYWHLEALSEDTFKAQLGEKNNAYLRTGDLGFLHENQLYVSGRLKDVIIIRGSNYYPQDIERTAYLSHGSLAPSAVAFGVEHDNKEQLILVQEVKKAKDDFKDTVEAIKKAIALEFELKAEVILIRPRTLDKTSSGKVQRRLTKQRYLDDSLEVIYQEEANQRESDGVNREAYTRTQSELVDLWQQVLNTYGLDLHSDFFALGGDSLEATRIIAWIEKYYAVEVQVETLYDYPTPELLAEYIEGEQTRLASAEASRHIESTGLSQAPLSFSQRRLWFLNQIESQSKTLNLSVALRLSGELNVVNFASALNSIVARHGILRTVYSWDGQTLLQRVNAPTDIDLIVEDLSGQDLAEIQAEAIAQAEAEQSFDLAEGPVFNVRLLRLANDCHHFIFTIHHIATDAWSMELFIKELNQFYVDPEQPLSVPEISYADYAAWQTDHAKSLKYQKLAAYWRKQLSDVPVMTTLPYDHPRPERQTFNGSKHSLALPSDLVSDLRSLSQAHKTTLFVTLLSAFQIEVQRLSGSTDVVVGTDIANRNHGQIADVIGFFVNQLVLRSQLDPSASFAQLLSTNRAMVLDAIAHQDMPFEQLVDELGVERSAGYSPLFQIKFLLNQSPLQSLDLPNLEATLLEQDVMVAQYDLTLSIDKAEGEDLVANFHYNNDLFDSSSIDSLAQDYLLILQSVAQHAQVDLKQIPSYQTSRADYMNSCHGKQVAYQDSIKKKIEASAQKFPEQCALACGPHQMTFTQLNAEANKLAHFLLDLDINQGDIVGINIGRSLNQVVSVVAINKIGAAFLPLDMDYPAERIDYMLQDSNVDYVLTEDDSFAGLENFAGGVITLDDERSFIQEEPDTNPDVVIDPQQRAYVLYTSGSSGQPKGVQIRQDSLHNLCHWYQEFAQLDAQCCVLQPIPLSFDASIKNILAPLMNGAKVVLPVAGPFDASVYQQTIIEHQVNVINCVPSMFYPILDEYRGLSSLKLLALGGEAADLPRFKTWLRESGSQCLLGNIYGPTECADISVAAKFTLAELEQFDVMPIGQPVNNARIYVVGDDMLPVPYNVPGELIITGKGVSPGYLGQAASKNQAFIKNFVDAGHGYRTGDVVRLDKQGNLHYLGRKDTQVKVNGVRIDVGEIESLLHDLSGIDRAVVLQRDGRLVANVLTTGLTPPDSKQMRDYLRRFLPLIWIPKAFIPLQSLPHLPNGKVNVQALMELPIPGQTERREVTAPRDETDAKMVAIWTEVLQLSSTGIDDNFFELGGDSMAAVRVVALAQEQGMEISVADIFERQSIQQLVDSLDEPSLTDDSAQPVGSEAFDMLSEDDLAQLNNLE